MGPWEPVLAAGSSCSNTGHWGLEANDAEAGPTKATTPVPPSQSNAVVAVSVFADRLRSRTPLARPRLALEHNPATFFFLDRPRVVASSSQCPHVPQLAIPPCLAPCPVAPCGGATRTPPTLVDARVWPWAMWRSLSAIRCWGMLSTVWDGIGVRSRKGISPPPGSPVSLCPPPA